VSNNKGLCQDHTGLINHLGVPIEPECLELQRREVTGFQYLKTPNA